MKITEARTLIEAAFQSTNSKTVWADLGCGGGTFTKALASLLGEGSKIYAVDREDQQIRPDNSYSAAIEFLKLNFINDPFSFSSLDGIMMANALHFVEDKLKFIDKVKHHLKPHGQIIVVEYDTENRNQWVPFPLSFSNLIEIFSTAGFSNIKKTGEKKSIYGSNQMYACSIKLN